MKSDYEPIIFDTDPAFQEIEVYPIHDLHMGNEFFDMKQWESVKAEILDRPNRFCIFVGDAMENAVPMSVSDTFGQTHTPLEQREWFAQQLIDLSGRTIAVVDGNHERNRSAKLANLYPLYDACIMAGLKDLYRPHWALLDIGVGRRERDPNQQVRYVVFMIHKAKECKAYSTADFVSGVHVVVSGHDHTSKDMPRAHLNYNPINKNITVQTTEHINCGSYLSWGGYSADNGYRPTSSKKFKLIFSGGNRSISTVGFYPAASR